MSCWSLFYCVLFLDKKLCSTLTVSILEDALPRRIMRLVPVFILETHNQTNNKCLPYFVQTDNVSSSIKTAIVSFYPAVYTGTGDIQDVTTAGGNAAHPTGNSKNLSRFMPQKPS